MGGESERTVPAVKFWTLLACNAVKPPEWFGFAWFRKVWNERIYVLKSSFGKIGSKCGNVWSKVTATPGVGSQKIEETVPVGWIAAPECVSGRERIVSDGFDGGFNDSVVRWAERKSWGGIVIFEYREGSRVRVRSRILARPIVLTCTHVGRPISWDKFLATARYLASYPMTDVSGVYYPLAILHYEL